MSNKNLYFFRQFRVRYLTIIFICNLQKKGHKRKYLSNDGHFYAKSLFSKTRGKMFALIMQQRVIKAGRVFTPRQLNR